MSSSPPTDTQPSDVLRVLLVEDNPGDARLLELGLQRANYTLLSAPIQLERAQCLPDALDALARTRFDAVLLDLGLPGSQGLDTLERFSAQMTSVPVIVLTGLDDPEVAARAVRYGAQDYLNKNQLNGDHAARALRYAIERHHAQQELHTRMADLDRLRTMGTMAAGTAHEINNPLAFATSNIHYALSLLQKSPPHEQLPEPLAAHLPEICQALGDALAGAQRVGHVVRELRRLAGDAPQLQDSSAESVHLERPLRSSINVARAQISQRARLAEEIAEVPDIWANEAKLGQVFLSLLINAAQAIPAGDAQGNEVGVRVRADSEEVVVEISDTGCGIPDRDRSQIFEPFFSTKLSTEGIGLGLTISKQIIASFGGSIEVDSQVGEGTTMRVRLPVFGPGLDAQSTEIDERRRGE